MALRLEQSRRGPLTLVQIGAFDGRTHDPVYSYVSEAQPRTVLVEPQPRPFALLQEAYRHQPRCTCVNAAISDQDGTRVLYTISDQVEGPDWLHQIASFRREVLLKHVPDFPGLERLITPLDVPCLTPQSLMRACALDSIDALIVDTEGFDAEVVKLFFAAGIRPAIVFYEHRHLSPADQNDCLSLLIQSGHQVAVLPYDVLAYRQRS